MRKFLLLLFVPLMLWSQLPPLQVGMELADPPFETVDENGEPSGLSVDLAYALGDYLHREVEIKDTPFLHLIDSLKSNRIDCIISSMAVTPERKKSIAFSTPYMRVGVCMLISSKSDLQDISQANQKGKVIIVKKTSTSEVWAKRHLKKAKVVAMDTVSACITEVVQGKADAFLYDQSTVYRAHKEYPEQTKVNLKPFATGEWAIGINKNNKELLEQVNKFL
ncbi:MAG TPA: transporter substrate-binding domain-containing protein, partial [Chlamydiales bacterium]|nr:transporter substrate-binding domain-containing protein [Chlamydiales bacterium]